MLRSREGVAFDATIHPCLIDPASSHMLVLYTCTDHDLFHPSHTRWLKSLSAKQVIHETIHAHNLSNKERMTKISAKKREREYLVNRMHQMTSQVEGTWPSTPRPVTTTRTPEQHNKQAQCTTCGTMLDGQLDELLGAPSALSPQTTSRLSRKRAPDGPGSSAAPSRPALGTGTGRNSRYTDVLGVWHLLLCRPWWRNSPMRTLGDPALRWHKLPGDGHECQVAGHTGKLQTTREADNKGRRRSNTRKHCVSKRVPAGTGAVKNGMLTMGPPELGRLAGA